MSKTDERIAELRDRWRQDPPDEIPAVLKQVRAERRAGHRTSPSSLYYMADEDDELYFHAMIEAGHIVRADGSAYPICPICEALLWDRP